MLMDFTWKSQKHWKKDYKMESFDYELRRVRKVGLALNYFFSVFFSCFSLQASKSSVSCYINNNNYYF